MKSSLSFLICFFITSLLGINAQQVSVIKEYNDNCVIHTTCFTNSGEILLSGTWSSMPLLIKVDTNGNEIFRNVYNSPPVKKHSNHSSFFRVTVDSMDNIYLYTAHERAIPFTPVDPYIVKLDKNGNPIWVSDYIPGHIEWDYVDLLGLILVFDSTLKVFSNGNEAVLDKQTGNILSFNNLGVNALPENQVPLWHNGYQWLSGNNQFTYFDAFGNALYKTHDKGHIPFWHLNDYSVYSIENKSFSIKIKGSATKFTTYSKAYLKRYDTIFSELVDELEYSPTPENINPSEDTFSCAIGSVICHPSKGVVGVGGVSYRQTQGSSMFGWLFQADSNGLEKKYDDFSLQHYLYDCRLLYQKNTIIGVSPIYSYYGVRVFKLDLPDIDTYPPTSTEELKTIERDTRVFPNPSVNGHFELRSSKEIDKIRVYRLSGQLVLEKNIKSLNTQLELTAKGVYVLQVYYTDGEKDVFKMINN